MWYIEGLLRETELCLNEKEKKIYRPVEIDLTKEQVNLIKGRLKKLYAVLEEAKSNFSLEVEPMKVSRIIDVNTSFIWKTIEDAWSSEMERKSGKIASAEKKKQIDNLLKKVLEFTNKIREIAKI
jgi:hypothetical protein